MTLREFIAELNEAPESQKDKILKYCGEWEAEIQSIELSDFDGAVLLIIRDQALGMAKSVRELVGKLNNDQR